VGKRKKPLIEKVTITDIGAEGKAIAKADGRILFVPFGIPGDVVDVQVNSARKKYYEGYIVRYHEHAPQKTAPFCMHFGTCGGCKWQHLPYADQLHYKQKQVTDNFERIGKLTGYKTHPILPSKNERFYRNKLEYTFSDSRWLTTEELGSDQVFANRDALGFHIPKKFDKILDIKECHLQPAPSNEIRLTVKKFAQENNYPFFNLLKQEGLLRNLIIRTSLLGETMVIVSFYYDDEELVNKMLGHIQGQFPQITSLMYVVNSKANETLHDQEIKVFSGRDHIFDAIEGLKFKIGPKSFYQTNSEQAATLYRAAGEMAGNGQNGILYDLYTGTGTIALYMAQHFKKVVGIEIVPEAIENAIENAEFNNIENVDFVAGDVKDVITEAFIEKHGKPDTVVVDPPRSGLHPSMIGILEKIQSQKIVYVSCNPATQARDISLLSESYFVNEIQPVDMFPHTHHVENIALLILKK
jgi:23S rRNA (uracil1939-C5)-methyltransferase